MPVNCVPWTEWKSQCEEGEPNNLEFLRQCLKQRQMTWLVGAGLTKGLFKQSVKKCSKIYGDLQSIQSWVELVKALKNAVGDPVEDVESLELLEQAYRWRFRLNTKGEWPMAMTDIIAKAMEAAAFAESEGYLCPLWQDVIQRIRGAAEAGHAPILMTTNYDDLLASQLGWNVVYFPDEPLKSNTPANNATLPSVPGARLARIVPNKGGQSSTDEIPLLNQIQRLEDFIGLHQTGWLSPQQHFVCHLHGWWGDPSSLIFDPGDYRQVERRAFEPVRRVFSSENHACVIVGTGEGLIDPHFVEYWKTLPAEVEGSNIWLLKVSRENSGSDDVDDVKKLRERIDQLMLKLDGKVTMVTFDDFSQLPEILVEILDV